MSTDALYYLFRLVRQVCAVLFCNDTSALDRRYNSRMTGEHWSKLLNFSINNIVIMTQANHFGLIVFGLHIRKSYMYRIMRFSGSFHKSKHCKRLTLVQASRPYSSLLPNTQSLGNE